MNDLPFLQESWKWKTTLVEKKLILEGPMFHFHDYGMNDLVPFNSGLITNVPPS